MSLTRIDRYVLRQLLLALFAVSGGLVALIWLTQSLRFVELVVNRGLSFRVFFQLTSLLIPNFVAVILPITTFVVVQFVYQRLAGDRELTVMRSAGLSQLALARPALLLAVFSMASCFLLNIWVVPAAFADFRQYQFEIRNRLAAFLLQEGVFTSVSDDLTVYVRSRDTDGTLLGIMVDDARDKNAHATIFAERGRLIANQGPPRVLLFKGSREEIDFRTGRLNVLTFAENSIDLAEAGNGTATRMRDPTEMSIPELLHPAPGEVAERDLPKLRVEAHRRLSAPFTALGYAMVALLASLTGTFRRHGGILRPLIAVLSVVALLAAALAVTNLAARNTALIPLIWLQALAPPLICGWLLFGAQLRLAPHGLLVRLGRGLTVAMPFAVTLSLYIVRVFMAAVVSMLAALTGLVALFDFIELLRRSATRPEATLGVVAEIAALRLPWVGMQILPFAVLLGAIIAFWRLTRSSELVVARAAGVSAWQFLAAPTFGAIMLGASATAGVTPISAVMRARADVLDDIYLNGGNGPLALNGGQLWLRQSDHELDMQGVDMLHALSVRAHGKELDARNVSIFRLNATDMPIQRIEARTARLAGGDWVLQDARTVTPGHLPDAPRTLLLPTDLTLSRVQESFAPPDTFSVWTLPGFIALLDRSGFSSVSHRLHFQSLLALPLLCGTMCLLGAGFSMRPQRRGGVAQMIGSGVGAGFTLFAISKLAEEFGQSGALPPALAAWAPAASGLMLSLALLLHLEDG